MDGIFVDDCSNESIEHEQQQQNNKRRKQYRNIGSTIRVKTVLTLFLGIVALVALSYGTISSNRQQKVSDDVVPQLQKKERIEEEANKIDNLVPSVKNKQKISINHTMGTATHMSVDKINNNNSRNPKQDDDGSKTTNNTTTNNETQKEEKSPVISSSSSSLLLCDPSIECMTDRWGNTESLTVGKSICNDVWRFGVVKKKNGGALVWQDCNTTEILYLQTLNTTTVSFQMTIHGVFQLLSEKDKVVWELESGYTESIDLHEKCLNDRPVMDCPYLHLRKRGGTIVLNYIEKNSTQWMSRKVHRIYPNLFPADFK